MKLCIERQAEDQSKHLYSGITDLDVYLRARFGRLRTNAGMWPTLHGSSYNHIVDVMDAQKYLLDKFGVV